MPPGALQDVLDTFAIVTDPVERANMLIGFADQFRPVPPEVATPPYPRDHLVPYCESEAYVWVVAQDDGTARLYFAVENPSGISAKALASILTSTLSGLNRKPSSRCPRISSSRSSGKTSRWGRGWA